MLIGPLDPDSLQREYPLVRLPSMTGALVSLSLFGNVYQGEKNVNGVLHIKDRIIDDCTLTAQQLDAKWRSPCSQAG